VHAVRHSYSLPGNSHFLSNGDLLNQKDANLAEQKDEDNNNKKKIKQQ